MFRKKRKQDFDDVDLDYSFDINKHQLNDLMKMRGKEATTALKEKYGGLNTLVKKLRSNVSRGLSSDPGIIDSHRKAFGSNVIPKDPPKNFFVLCWEAMQDPLLIVLLVCAVISIGLSFYQQKDSDEKLEWIEGVAIFIAVLVVVVVSAANDWQKDRQFRSLQNRIDEDKFVTVLRDGNLCEVNKADLVVGDVYAFKYGDLLQADGFFIQGNDVRIDESSLTGESDLIKKNETNMIMLSGTNVMEGSGHMLVTAVGINSQMGQIFLLLGSHGGKQESECSSRTKGGSDDTDVSPSDNKGSDDSEKKKSAKKKKMKSKSVLQAKLQRLAVLIGYIGLAAAFLTLFALILRFCISTYVINKQKWQASHINYFVNAIVQAITVIVVAVPEGLPLAVTLALAFAVKRMLKDNNLVRHLNACETMGNATTICSDKTGTLTTNRMTVTQCYIAEKYYSTVPSPSLINDELLDVICEAISVNTGYSSMLIAGDSPNEPKKQLGNKTECGLLQFVNDLGRNYEEIREMHPESEFYKVFTFNSARKMMSTVITTKSGYTLYTKGASEMVLKRCTYIYTESGKIQPLTGEKLNFITQGVIERMAGCALRTICIAYRKISKEEGDSYARSGKWDDDNVIVQNLTCLCITGIQDPVRPEVPESIRLCQKAGVVVRMVTGDNINTARSIARDCGIITPSSDFLVLESEEFNRRIRDSNGDISQELFDEVWPNLRVLARSSPQDKYNLVKGIVDSKATQHREVVAVTGDGTNDAPALKMADVGFAMGIQGTDVAKDASDIILTDDNFASIVKAVMWGRNVYDSIAKFLQFQLTANLSAGVFSVVSAAAISAVPLTAVQMLWVNLIMDTLASLALASEKPTKELLNRKPYGRTKFIISPLMFRNIVGESCYQLFVMFLLVFKGDAILDTDSAVRLMQENPTVKHPTRHFTAIFNTFVLMTLFNEVNSRKLHGEANVFKGVFTNFIFLGIWLGCFFVQAIIVTFGGIAFSTARLTASDWGYCLLFGVGSLLFGQFLNLIPANSFSKAVKRIDSLTRRRRKIEEMPIMDGETEADYDEDEDEIEEMEMLWFRGVKRIQTQTKVVDIFRSSIL